MKVDPRSFKGLSRFLAPAAGGPLADRALAEKIITLEQLQECVREQDRTGRPLDEIFVERGYLKPDQVERLRQPSVPAEAVEASADPLRVLGHYVLVSLLGSGGMAEVWKAWDRSLGRWVAVKYLRPDVGHPTQRIEREGRMAGGLSHPGIITIFERGMANGRPYLVMPYVDGRPPRAPMAPRDAARLAYEVAQALAHAHGMGVIHRDIKPANILVETGGRVVLTDFGLAIPGGTGVSLWAMSGTPEYASPEQVRGEVLDARTDIYSLGATLYHLLSGRPPFWGSDAEEIGDRVLAAEPPPLANAPRPLAAAVRKAMARNREDRYREIGAFAADLAAFLERSAARPRLTRRELWAIVAAGVVSWGITYFILAGGQAREERQAVLQSLLEGERELAYAERLRADPTVPHTEVADAARRAFPHFTLAIRRAGGADAEAGASLGRCYELIGDDLQAEGYYRDARALRRARMGLVRVWLRRHLEGRRDRDWRAQAGRELDSLRADASGDTAAALWRFVEMQWADVLSLGVRALERERHDDMLLTAVAVAARELGRWDEAVVRFDQAIRLRGWDGTLWYHKAQALAGKGDRAAAAHALREALRRAAPGWPLRVECERRLSEVTK
jgi:Ser/Thr protein kinase RdoA (MazF antagonist)